jgi:hypothetical protein
MTQTELVGTNSDGMIVTPHSRVSQNLFASTEATRKRCIDLLIKTFAFDSFDAETLVSACASLAQLKSELSDPKYFYTGNHKFTYLELDIVTWRILPSPENVRFEDRRLGNASPLRFTTLSNTPPVLKLSVPSLPSLFEELQRHCTAIKETNPHTQTVKIRGIEHGGILAVSRVISDADTVPFGVLESTDGFSRTVGALDGLQISIRDIVTKFNRPSAEARYRKDLIELRDKDLSGNRISDEDATRLRSSIMPRAKVIVSYSFEGAVAGNHTGPNFDEARRDLVGHLHMAPALKFENATIAASKARAIRSALLREDFLPNVRNLSPAAKELALDAQIDEWLSSGLELDQLAPFLLQSYKPLLTTKEGKVVREAVQTLTGQSAAQEDLTNIAVEVALIPAIKSKALSPLQEGPETARIRSTLSKTWDSTLFTGVKFSNLSVDELLEASLQELKDETTTQSGGRPSTTARAELAAIASYAMAALAPTPLLERAKGKGDNDEPNKIMAALIKREQGLKQLAYNILEIRAGRTPRMLAADAVELAAAPDAPIAGRESLKAITEAREVIVEEAPLTPSEQLISKLNQLTEGIIALEGFVVDMGQIQDDAGARIVETQGMSIQSQVDQLNDVRMKLEYWNMTAKALAQRAIEALNGDASEDF